MKRLIITASWLLTTILSITLSGTAQFNRTATLKIGDPAPAFKVQEWVRGNPLTEFKKGKVYVIDFWATWCGGCIVSFPQISSLAEKYKGKAHFIAVDSYEDLDEKNKGKDPAPLVKEFLKTSYGQKLKLDVAVDGMNNTMYQTWVNKLRRNGFPTTFIIDQEGKIAWVDVNLDHLEWALNQVLAKKWDRNKAAEIMKQKDAIEEMMFGIYRSKAEDKTKDYQNVLTAAEAFEKQFPDRKDAVASFKLQALVELDMERVPALLEQMTNDPLSRYLNLYEASAITARKKDLSKSTYAAIAKVQERLLSHEYPWKGYGGKTVRSYEALADTYAKMEDISKALAYTEQALELAQQQQFPAEQIKKLYENLVKYRQAVIK